MIRRIFVLIFILCLMPTYVLADTANTAENTEKTSKVIKKANEKNNLDSNKSVDSASEKSKNPVMTIKEEIEQAKKEMDSEAEALQDVYDKAAETKTTTNQIFDEEMEIEGKTFWGRKPIHPIGKYGYKGSLPDIGLEFEYKKTKDEYKCLIPANPNATKADLIIAPRNDKAYVDIVIKKGASSQYVNDVNDVIFILQKLIANIEDDVNVQKFNAQVSGLLDNIFYIQDKYKNKPEAHYISYSQMLELASMARDVAILRTEAQAYSKYLAYSGEGAAYRPDRIKAQMNRFLAEINKTMKILKEVN